MGAKVSACDLCTGNLGICSVNKQVIIVMEFYYVREITLIWQPGERFGGITAC